MELNIEGRNLAITDSIDEYVRKKIGRLDRYLPTIQNAQVEIKREQTKSAEDRHVVQLTVYSNRTILRAEEHSSDVFAAVDSVLDKMYRQVKRYKGKRRRRMRGEPLPMPEYEEEEFEDELEADEYEHNIVRRKRFEALPMNEQEAIDQMELLGHDFFIFMNADSAEVNVVYRRHDGDYGILEPIIE